MRQGLKGNVIDNMLSSRTEATNLDKKFSICNFLEHAMLSNVGQSALKTAAKGDYCPTPLCTL